MANTNTITPTPNNFFKEDKYGTPSAEPNNVTTFDELAAKRAERESDKQAKKPEAKKGVSKSRLLIGAGMATAALAAGATSVPERGNSEPVGTDAPAAADAQESTTPTSIHTVRKGETAWGIAEQAQKNGDIPTEADIRPTVDAIADQQGEDGMLHPGDKVAVPVEHKEQ